MSDISKQKSLDTGVQNCLVSASKECKRASNWKESTLKKEVRENATHLAEKP